MPPAACSCRARRGALLSWRSCAHSRLTCGDTDMAPAQVLHTVALNSSTTVRNQIAQPKIFSRMEKQLAKPQAPVVGAAIMQALVDWAHLFPTEELGRASRAILSHGRYSQAAASVRPSASVLVMQEEMQLGIPPVAPVRGEDFFSRLFKGALHAGQAGGVQPGGGRHSNEGAREGRRGSGRSRRGTRAEARSRAQLLATRCLAWPRIHSLCWP